MSEPIIPSADPEPQPSALRGSPASRRGRQGRRRPGRRVSGLVAALLVRGHVLLEGVPGVAKTLLVKTLAARARPRLQAGAVHARPDAVRRHRADDPRPAATAASGSARARCSRTCCWPTRSTAPRPRPRPRCWRRWRSGRSRSRAPARPLPDPFVVVATQNPIEYEGTYPLPEAQLDRFLFKLLVGYPTFEQETTVLERHHRGLDPHDLVAAGVRPVATAADLAAARPQVDGVRVEPAVLQYMVALVPGDPGDAVGAARRVAPWRGRAAARLEGLGVAVRSRPFVTPDEVKAVAEADAAPSAAHPSRARARGHDGRRRARRHPRQRPGASLTGSS